jgi:hypothetical protein
MVPEWSSQYIQYKVGTSIPDNFKKKILGEHHVAGKSGVIWSSCILDLPMSLTPSSWLGVNSYFSQTLSIGYKHLTSTTKSSADPSSLF